MLPFGNSWTKPRKNHLLEGVISLIVTMKKVLLLGDSQHRAKLLEKLQEIGVVHIEPLSLAKAKHVDMEDELDKTRKALEILSACPHDDACGDGSENPESAVKATLEMDSKLRDLREQLSELDQKRAEVAAWGNFSRRDLDALEAEGVTFRFWRCPAQDFGAFRSTLVLKRWQDGNEIGVLTVNYLDDCEAPSGALEQIFPDGSRELAEKIRETEEKRESLLAELRRQTRCLPLLRRHERDLADRIALLRADEAALRHEDVFGLSGWVPADLVPRLKEELREYPAALEFRDCGSEDQPPTLLRNPKWIQSILDVVKLYATPGYKEWDSSTPVYFAFTLFFGMIVGDAGYGLIMLALMLWLRRRLMGDETGERVFRLMTSLGLSVLIFGILSGTYFAINLAPENPLNHFKVIPGIIPMGEGDNGKLMWMSILVGAAHLSVARLINASRILNSTLCLVEFGWIAAIWGAVLYIGAGCPWAYHVLFGGLATVFLFSSTSWNPFKRLLGGAFGLLGVSQNLSDTLSYLRLFALGLATVIMGQNFNSMAVQVQQAVDVPVLGTLLMILIIFIGHTINMVLGVMGGFIHGLRLNFLEFYRYCFEGTGHDYKPLVKTNV